MTSDDIETYPKQVKHDDFPSFSDRFITQTSTPIGKDDLNVSNVTATIDPVDMYMLYLGCVVSNLIDVDEEQVCLHQN
jgi:hypothetical protein